MRSIIVHGGAWDIPDDAVENHHQGILEAVSAGWEILHRGGTALDAVETAIRQMEEDPTYDAGRGSFVNAIGDVEMDASIMDGAALEVGAVAAIQGILHPITLARRVMERSEHVLLVSEGAMRFAREQDIPFCTPEDLLVGRELERWREIRKIPDYSGKIAFSGVPETGMNAPGDTVGCVALDEQGNLAAGTSTGGTPNKYPGRVGDSPIIGSGTYALNSVGGASTTGWGESIMKVVLSKSVVDGIELLDMSPSAAAERGISQLRDRADGYGGVIVLDARGEPGVAWNTPRMARGWMNEKMKEPFAAV